MSYVARPMLQRVHSLGSEQTSLYTPVQTDLPVLSYLDYLQVFPLHCQESRSHKTSLETLPKSDSQSYIHRPSTARHEHFSQDNVFSSVLYPSLECTDLKKLF